jgi:pimeloyl-ACP methyl ester carboxylesterase
MVMRSVILPFAIAWLGCTPAIAQPPLPRFESGPCAFQPGDWAKHVRLECGMLVVAMDRAHPERKQLRLAVAVLRPQRPSTTLPVAILHGGPAGPGGLRADSMALAVRWSAVLDRDIVVYDQRGAGFSEPPLCPEVAAQAEGLRNETSEVERERGWLETARRCVVSLKRDGIDPHFFNSRANAADLIDLRKILGYSSWDVVGVSYGARLAQEVMRRDREGVHSAILASPLIPGAAKAEDALSVQRALERIFAACRAQPACRSAFSSAEQDLYELYAELNAKPIDVIVERNDSPVVVVLDGHRLLRDMVGRFSVGQIDRVPLLLHELRRGDRNNAARRLVGNGLGRNVQNPTLTNLVMCHDVVGSVEYRRAFERVKSLLKEPFRALANDGGICSGYLEKFADSADQQFVRSDIPTLILSNEFDDRTPTEHGRRIAASLRHAYLFELPGLAHAATPPGCFDTIVQSFLQNPARPPDAECIAAMPRLSFETRRLDRPMLFFSIDATDTTGSRFAGAWDAAFPDAPRPFSISLRISGGKVAGSITAGAGALNVPILEGTADGRVLTFKVSSPQGGRTITFTGTFEGDAISFVRDVVVPPGADAGGNALWGVSGPRTFTARRVQ